MAYQWQFNGTNISGSINSNCGAEVSQLAALLALMCGIGDSLAGCPLIRPGNRGMRTFSAISKSRFRVCNVCPHSKRHLRSRVSEHCFRGYEPTKRCFARSSGIAILDNQSIGRAPLEGISASFCKPEPCQTLEKKRCEKDKLSICGSSCDRTFCLGTGGFCEPQF